MIILGLTGSIAMGKSTLADMLRQEGIPVHDADACVHGLIAPGGPAQSLIQKAFPRHHYPRIYKPRWFSWQRVTIDRKKLGALVFSDDQARRMLEAILHPMVRREQDDFLRHCRVRGFGMAAMDIPLLFETGAQTRVHYTLCASSPGFVQKARALSRPGMTPERLTSILATQMPDAQKRALADYTVETGLGRAFARKRLRAVLAQIKARALTKDAPGADNSPARQTRVRRPLRNSRPRAL